MFKKFIASTIAVLSLAVIAPTAQAAAPVNTKATASQSLSKSTAISRARVLAYNECYRRTKQVKIPGLEALVTQTCVGQSWMPVTCKPVSEQQRGWYCSIQFRVVRVIPGNPIKFLRYKAGAMVWLNGDQVEERVVGRWRRAGS